MAVPDETRRAYERAADEFCRAFATPAPTLSKTSEAPVVAVHDDGTIDVGYGGAVLTVRMTTACAGVAVGDTVLLTAYGQMLYATGILARDNRHYVKLWEGSWESGSIDVPGSSGFDLMVFVFANADPNRWATLSACIYGDDGIKTYYPSFDSYVSNGVLAYVSAKITSSGDVLTLGGKSQAVIRRVATPLQQLDMQTSRIVEVYGVR